MKCFYPSINPNLQDQDIYCLYNIFSLSQYELVFFYNSSLRLVNIHGVIFCSENWWSRWKIGFRFGTEYRLSAVCSKSLVFMCFIACVKFVQYLIRHVRKDGCGVESFLTFHKKEQRKGGPRNMSGECST